MILVDTSVWVDHLRRVDVELTRLLDTVQVLTHAMVIGELAMGNLQNRNIVLSALQNLPRANVAVDEEVLRFITRHGLNGTGMGYVYAHLLAAVQLTHGALLWTRDRRLVSESRRLGLCANMTH